MRNRIREYRQLKNMTQGDLAQRVGTTSQTISRLEGGNMTLSTDWLVRFADVFDIHPTDLLEQPETRDIPLIGTMDAKGDFTGLADECIGLDAPVTHPIAIRLTEPILHYQSGDILICDHIQNTDKLAASDKDYFVRLKDHSGVLGRILLDARKGTDSYMIVPFTSKRAPVFAEDVALCARVVMRISYY